VNNPKAILKCSISRKHKACSYAPSTSGAAYAASGAWRAQGRASHTLRLSGPQPPLLGDLVTCRRLSARAPVLGLCLYVSVNVNSSLCVCARVLVTYTPSVSTTANTPQPRRSPYTSQVADSWFHIHTGMMDDTRGNKCMSEMVYTTKGAYALTRRPVVWYYGVLQRGAVHRPPACASHRDAGFCCPVRRCWDVASPWLCVWLRRSLM